MTPTQQLADHYVAAVNAALQADDADLVRELADDFTDEALAALLDAA